MEPVLSVIARHQRWRVMAPYLRGRILDLGCGWTTWPDHILGIESYLGVDSNQDAVSYNFRKYPQHTFLLRNFDYEPLGLEEARFDVVVLSAVIEHLIYPEKIISELPLVMEREGILLITSPTRLGDFVHRIGSRLGLFYSEATLGHVRVFSKSMLFGLLEKYGYPVITHHSFAFFANQLVVCGRPDSLRKDN